MSCKLQDPTKTEEVRPVGSCRGIFESETVLVRKRRVHLMQQFQQQQPPVTPTL